MKKTKVRTKLDLMSDSHSHDFTKPRLLIKKLQRVCVWVGDKNKMPKGWIKISEKEAVKLLGK